MDAALRSLLLNDAGVGAIAGVRVDWGVRPEGDPLPGIALHLIADLGTVRRRSRSAWNKAVVQVDCWARTFHDANRLASAVKDALTGYSGVIAGRKLRILPVEGSGASDTDKDKTGVVHRVRPEFRIWHSPQE